MVADDGVQRIARRAPADPKHRSSLFPQLPPASRKAFLLGLVLLLVALVAATWFRLPAALITVAALGLPLLFLIYLQEADAHRDIPSGTLVITAALGIGLGVGWVLLTGAAVAQSYGVPLGRASRKPHRPRRAGHPHRRHAPDARACRAGPTVPAGTARVVGRLRNRCPRCADVHRAATLTRLAPQFTTGMIARARPMDGLMVEAGIRGIAVPLTAACVGGLMGAALWSPDPPTRREGPHLRATGPCQPRSGRYGDVRRSGIGRRRAVPQILQLAVHLTIAVIALLALRIGLHLALLHEAHDEVREDDRSCARSAVRRARYGLLPGVRGGHPRGVAVVATDPRDTPVRIDPAPHPRRMTMSTVVPGYSVLGGTYTSRRRRPKTSHRRLVVVWVLAIAVVAAGLVALSGALEKPKPRYVCPPDCGHRHWVSPSTINPRFTSDDGAFSVAYPAEGSAYQITTAPNSVTANLQAGDGGTMRLFSEPAAAAPRATSPSPW